MAVSHNERKGPLQPQFINQAKDSFGLFVSVCFAGFLYSKVDSMQLYQSSLPPSTFFEDLNLPIATLIGFGSVEKLNTFVVQCNCSCELIFTVLIIGIDSLR